MRLSFRRATQTLHCSASLRSGYTARKSSRFVALGRPIRSVSDSANVEDTLYVLGRGSSFKLAVPLPSKERQLFSLPSEGQQLRGFLQDLSVEDPAISAVAVYNKDGVRLSGSTFGHELVDDDWTLKINDKKYTVKSPLRSKTGHIIHGLRENPQFQAIKEWVREEADTHDTIPYSTFVNKCQDLGITADLANQYARALTSMGSILYFEGNLELSDRLFLNPHEIQQSVERVLDLPHIQMSQADRIVLLDTLKKELAPLEEQRNILLARADKNVQVIVWSIFGLLGAQFVLFARLTWWESSWDVMEPVTYFTTVVETIIASYIWFLYTGKEYAHMSLRDILFQWRFRRLCEKTDFDTARWTELKERIAQLEHEINQFSDDATLVR